MKPSDKIILDSLRKGECSHISEAQWLLVEKAVTDAGDVRSVTGMAQTIIFDAIKKGRFSSRSEAGRYAANMRWKGQGEKTVSSGKGSKQKYDFSPRDYKMVREAVPQISANDAKKLTQYLLDNNAFGDTSEMSLEQMGREFRMYLDDALGGGGSDEQGSMPKGRTVVTEKNLSAPLPAEDAKNYKKDRKAALSAFGDVRNHIYALEIAVNARTSDKELQSHLDQLKEDVTSWKSAFDDAGDTPTVKGAIKMTAAVGLGETIKNHMRRVHEKTGWTGDKFEDRAQKFEYALQSAADKNFGVSPKKYDISDAIYRDIEQEDWA